MSNDSKVKLMRAVKVGDQIKTCDTTKTDSSRISIVYDIQTGHLSVDVPDDDVTQTISEDNYNEAAALVTAFSALLVGLHTQNIAAHAGFEVIFEPLMKCADQIIDPDIEMIRANLSMKLALSMGLFR